MTTNPSLLNTFRAEIKQRLGELDFEQCKQDIFLRPAGETAEWIGLNRASHSDGIEINPVMGIRHQRVEELVSQLLGVPVTRCIPPTLSVSLGYLTGDNRYVAWRVSEQSPPHDAAAQLARTIAQRGIPFMQSYGSLEAVTSAIAEGKYITRESARFRLPVCLLLKGDFQAATKIIERDLMDLSDRDDLAAHRFRKFVEEFMYRGSQDGNGA